MTAKSIGTYSYMYISGLPNAVLVACIIFRWCNRVHYWKQFRISKLRFI